jgi:hypothetical protein
VLILVIVIGPVILFRDSLRAGEGEDGRP